MTTASGVNVAKQTTQGNLSDEKKGADKCQETSCLSEEKENDAVKLHGDIQTSLTMSGMNVCFLISTDEQLIHHAFLVRQVSHVAPSMTIN